MVMMFIMNQSDISLRLIFYYALVLLLVCTKAAFGGEADTECIERERQSLLIFKQGLADEWGSLSSWGSTQDCCKWTGVYCGIQTGHVVMLDLNSFNLRGNISSSLLVLQHLNYLDLSDNNFGGNQIPEFIGSLTKLRFLDLCNANFSGRVPYQLGNLTNLQSLTFGFGDIHVSKFEWLSHLYKLTSLSLVGLHLEEATDWLQVITGLPSLKYLNMSSSNLPIPTFNYQSHSLVNSSTSLSQLFLSDCGLSNSAYHFLSNISKSIVSLDLSLNQFTGISKSLRDMCSLEVLYMDNNNLTGLLPDLLLNLSGCAKKSLSTLMLGNNSLSGSLPDITEFSSLQELYLFNNSLDGSFPEEFKHTSSLVELDLGINQLWGPLPDLSVFPLLRRLDISYNRLNGSVSQSLGQLSRLHKLNLNSNSLQGLITEAHLSHLSVLEILDFSYNSLALNFSPGWIPPFQLEDISLTSCKLGPRFPKWLRSQTNHSHLDISNAGISDTVPSWFWDNLSPKIISLNLSYNQMKGEVPDLSSKFYGFEIIDLSSNCFEGTIQPMPNVSLLFLSKNLFSGSIFFLCNMNSKFLEYIDLSDNQLSGRIPDCSGNWTNLILLNLANNNFSGRIPNSIDSKCSLRSLHLRNNCLTGELPSSLKSCRSLRVIDLGNNKISGSIPLWINESLLNLIILSLRSNYINGRLPPQLCNLTQVQVLDVADNNITGTLPNCLNSLTAMIRRESPSTMIKYTSLFGLNNGSTAFENNYVDHAWLVWKGIVSQYKSTLRLVKSIDLSSNKLFGEIPEEFTSLIGLLSLNLSRNSLTGPIPPKIGKLTLLNSLDLSQNRLNGKIPESSSQLSHLGVLNLSNNHFSGKIPSGAHLQTFDASSFMGNPNLCGSPLQKKCPGEEPAAPQDPPIVVYDSEDDGFITRGFYITATLGFVVGFWGFWGTLLLNRNWRYAYFQLIDEVKDQLYVCMAVKMAHLKRRLRI